VITVRNYEDVAMCDRVRMKAVMMQFMVLYASNLTAVVFIDHSSWI